MNLVNFLLTSEKYIQFKGYITIFARNMFFAYLNVHLQYIEFYIFKTFVMLCLLLYNIPIEVNNLNHITPFQIIPQNVLILLYFSIFRIFAISQKI